MVNNNSKPLGALKSDSQTQPAPWYFNRISLNQLENWFDSELDELVLQHQEWQTPHANRKYFGR